MRDEHTTFNSLIDHIGEAAHDASYLQTMRQDQPWNKVADKLNELKEHLLRMVGDGHIGGLEQ